MNAFLRPGDNPHRAVALWRFAENARLDFGWAIMNTTKGLHLDASVRRDLMGSTAIALVPL